jgi:hypothetical protein
MELHTNGMIICVEVVYYLIGCYICTSYNVVVTQNLSATCQKIKHDELHLYVCYLHYIIRCPIVTKLQP